MPVVEFITVIRDIEYICDVKGCGGSHEFYEKRQGLTDMLYIHYCKDCSERLELEREYPYRITTEGHTV
jgi:hypothetical protein